jgi:hypothetical protein
MGPPVTRFGHPDPGAAPDPPYCDRKDHVFAVRGTMTLAGEGRCDFVIGGAVAGQIEHPVTHLCPSREFGDGVDLQLDFKIAHSAATPDDPDQSDIVLASVEHHFIHEAA